MTLRNVLQLVHSTWQYLQSEEVGQHWPLRFNSLGFWHPINWEVWSGFYSLLLASPYDTWGGQKEWEETWPHLPIMGTCNEELISKKINAVLPPLTYSWSEEVRHACTKYYKFSASWVANLTWQATYWCTELVVIRACMSDLNPLVVDAVPSPRVYGNAPLFHAALTTIT